MWASSLYNRRENIKARRNASEVNRPQIGATSRVREGSRLVLLSKQSASASLLVCFTPLLSSVDFLAAVTRFTSDAYFLRIVYALVFACVETWRGGCVWSLACSPRSVKVVWFMVDIPARSERVRHIYQPSFSRHSASIRQRFRVHGRRCSPSRSSSSSGDLTPVLRGLIDYLQAQHGGPHPLSSFPFPSPPFRLILFSSVMPSRCLAGRWTPRWPVCCAV